MSGSVANSETKAKARAGKYLTFRLGVEVYGLEILKVKEISPLGKVTEVARMPAAVRGVMELHDSILPVVDLRLRLGLAAFPDTEHTCIVVVDVERKHEPVTLGIIVDEVCEVLDVSPHQVTPVPSQKNTPACVTGACRIVKTATLLDGNRILNDAELAAVAGIPQMNIRAWPGRPGDSTLFTGNN